MPTWNEFVDWAIAQGTSSGGRKPLRRRWTSLRRLAQSVAEQIAPREIEDLLGKPFSQLDPEQNDLKALVAYGAGKGLVADVGQLRQVLQEDMRADPLHFLAPLSGKTFGEKFAPLFAEYWLVVEGDSWVKQSSKCTYDVGWMPRELDGKEIRIELKASSEHPAYRFQQIRHPRMGGANADDYDLLLCVGVCASSLEWWAIPVQELDAIAETGSAAHDRVIITRHHGKRRPIWNPEYGYSDEGWFRADARARTVLSSYACANSERLRATILSFPDPMKVK